jgi:hypothetical protein
MKFPLREVKTFERTPVDPADDLGPIFEPYVNLKTGKTYYLSIQNDPNTDSYCHAE